MVAGRDMNSQIDHLLIGPDHKSAGLVGLHGRKGDIDNFPRFRFPPPGAYGGAGNRLSAAGVEHKTIELVGGVVGAGDNGQVTHPEPGQ